MRMLAFDQATQKTGVSYYEDGALRYCGLLDCGSIKDTDERFREMTRLIMGKIDEYSPDIVVFEDTDSGARSPRVLRLLSQMQGVIIGKCVLLDIPYHIYKASEWRQRLHFQQGPKIKREELKKQALSWVSRHYNFDPQIDEAEAVCIGAAYLKEFGNEK